MTGRMRVRVVGSSCSVPRPARACSAHLVRTDRTSVLLDVGTGAFAKLREAMNYSALGAVVITHMHADHFLDLVPLRYGLKYGPLTRSNRMPMWLPPGGEEQLRALVAAFPREGRADFLDEVYDVREYDPSSDLHIGDLRLTFAKTAHYVDAYAIRAESGGTSTCYSADTAPCEQVERLAHGCNLFLCEASLGLASEDASERGHLSAAEAGTMAQRAAAERLLIVHYGTEYTPAQLADAARTTYDGACSVADDGTEIDI
jgi:ribonuclease BN (tRNA processing enzyme)